MQTVSTMGRRCLFVADSVYRLHGCILLTRVSMLPGCPHQYCCSQVRPLAGTGAWSWNQRMKARGKPFPLPVTHLTWMYYWVISNFAVCSAWLPSARRCAHWLVQPYINEICLPFASRTALASSHRACTFCPSPSGSTIFKDTFRYLLPNGAHASPRRGRGWMAPAGRS